MRPSFPLLTLAVLPYLPACHNASMQSDLAPQDLAVNVYPRPYTIQAFDNARITSRGGMDNSQHVRTTIDLRDAPFAQVKLVADLGSACFPFSKWQTDPPPPGQNWPADCDAFDRNYEFTLDEPAAMNDPPALELVRAITPFGGPMHLEADVTDVFNGLPGQHSLTVTIPTYSDSAGKVTGSDGGWNVTVRLEVTPGAAPHKVLAVKPLFNLYGGMMGISQPYPVTVPAGTTSARLEYRATGHGGGDPGTDPSCIGPAEEFCRRKHTAWVDGQKQDAVLAWRNDCDKNCTVMHDPTLNIDYCAENPCGNMQSVRAPRANWCPGTVTPPIVWQFDPLKVPGMHTFQYGINRIDAGGGWRLSAVYFAFGD